MIENAPLPRPAVGVVIWKDPTTFLLVRRAKPPKQGEWSLPGGRQEWGETIADAARREVLEETGLTVNDLRLVDVVDFIDADGAGFHYTLIDFAATWTGGVPEPADDVSEARWFELDDLPGLGLWPETARIIRQSRPNP